MKLSRFIKEQLIDKDLRVIFLMFIIWKIGLFIVFFIAIYFFPLAGHNFLGGGFNNYLNNPYIFAWANFDGEHYLSIAQIGYRGLEQAFFPVYPMLISFLSKPFVNDIYSSLVFGTVVSN